METIWQLAEVQAVAEPDIGFGQVERFRHVGATETNLRRTNFLAVDQNFDGQRPSALVMDPPVNVHFSCRIVVEMLEETIHRLRA